MEPTKFKMMLLVRTDLGMKKGKAMSQATHAGCGIYKNIIAGQFTEQQLEWVREWEEDGAAKIALRAPTEQDIDKLVEEAGKLGVPTYVQVDAGLTQVAPNSKTCLAVGPAPTHLTTQLCGAYKLMT